MIIKFTGRMKKYCSQKRYLSGHRLSGKLIILVCLIFAAGNPVYASERPVFLISSEENSAYKLAEEGIMDALHTSVDVEIYYMKDGKNFPFRDIDRNRPAAIITIGSLASKTAYIDSREGNISSPIIISMVLRPDVNRIYPSRRLKVTGITLDIPYTQQFSKIKGLLPDVRKVGFLYKPGNKNKIDEAYAAAAANDLELIGFELRGRSKLAEALDRLIEEEEIDLFWPGVDVSIYSREVLQYIIHRTNRGGIPFIGHSYKYLEWGALLSLDVNYKEVGKQTGSLVNEIVRERKTVESEFYPPAQEVRYSINLDVANKLKIIFPAEVIDNAYFTID